MQEQKQKNEVGRGLNDGSTSVSTKNARPRDARRAGQSHSSEVKRTHVFILPDPSTMSSQQKKSIPSSSPKRCCVVGDGERPRQRRSEGRPPGPPTSPRRKSAACSYQDQNPKRTFIVRQDDTETHTHVTRHVRPQQRHLVTIYTTKRTQ